MADSMDYEDVEFDQHIEEVDAGRKRRKRVRNWTAEDRARHRVFERSRREAFNERLNELALLLPSLKDAKETQLSKHVIVDESVKHHISQQEAIVELSRSLEDLRGRHEQLLAEVNSWRRAAGGLSIGELATAPGAHTGASPTPEVRFAANAEVPAISMPYDGVPEMQQHAASDSRPILPKLGTYPGDFVPLVSDLTSMENVPALEALNGPVPTPNVSEMGHTLGDVRGSLAPSGTSVAFETEGLQSLFDHFYQDATAEAGDPRAGRIYTSNMHHTNAPEMEPWVISPELQDLWRNQWPLNNAGDWGRTNAAADYAEMNAMHFRNNTSIMNI